MRYFTIAVLLFLCSFANAQQNLVPNPSFEDTVYCPYGLNQIDACANWLNFGNSPDYFNACATNGVTVPNSNFGFMYAHTGKARAGIVGYYSFNPNYREFLGTQLLSPLQIGTKYYISFWISRAAYINMACNKIGMRFSSVPFDSCCAPPINNISQLHIDTIITDTTIWHQVLGSFISDSSYRYLSIANFFTDSLTDTIKYTSFSNVAYYYIDDICVSTDSIYNNVWTGIAIKNNMKSKIICFPNPFSNYLYLSNNEFLDTAILYTIEGLKIKEFFFNKQEELIKLNFENLGAGNYLLKISGENTVITKHILKL